MPYRLFALSNLSSLFGLLAYPCFVEPKLTLSEQSGYWSGAYVAFTVLCAVTASASTKSGKGENPGTADVENSSGNEPAPPATREKILWMFLAACASVLLLSTTNYLTQDIASIPFLWVLPLSLYLLSFILCFDRNGWYRRGLYVWIMASVLGSMAYALVQWSANYDIEIKIPFFCAGLFACCMFCHGELAVRKPAPRYLTSFYLMISLGGALGGVLVCIIVPKTLSGPFEFAIALSACALLLFLVNFRRTWINGAVCGLLVGAMVYSTCIYISSFVSKSRFLARNFYGCLKVEEYDTGTRNEHRNLVNGVIIHGIQFQAQGRRKEPVSYYSPDSGIGLAIQSLPKKARRVGIIGLGVGTLAGYARHGDYFHFYEINPIVKDVALKEFSFLSECRGKTEISIGDGRLLLQQEHDQQYDLLAVDAFSGDSIPVHLLTAEAVQLYFRHLKPDGILALHITNTNLDLVPVVGRIREVLGKHAVLIRHEGDVADEIYNSTWVLMTTGRDLMNIAGIRKASGTLENRTDIRVWTDDYSNLIQIIKHTGSFMEGLYGTGGIPHSDVLP